MLENDVKRQKRDGFWIKILELSIVPDLQPPLDVYWAWSVHMLCPRMYAKDCTHLIGLVPWHKFRLTKNQPKSQDKTKGRVIFWGSMI